MTLRQRFAGWLLADTASTPPEGEVASYGANGTISQFGDTSARIGTYRADKVGFATYAAMERHFQVGAGADLITLPLLAAEYSVEGEPRIASYVDAVTERVWESFVRSCAVGVLYGCAPHEIVWERADTEVAYSPEEDAPEVIESVAGWRPSKLKDLDPASVSAILVDGLENFAGYKAAGNVELDAEKAVHFAYDMRHGNLWGRARLTRAYEPWYRYCVIWDQMVRYLDKFATPSLKVFFPPGKTDGQNHSATALSIGSGFTGNETYMALPLIQGEDGTWVKSWDVELLQDEQRVNPYVTALDMHGKAILRALLIPDTLFTQSNTTGSLALSQTHADVYDAGEDAILRQIVATYNAQVVPRIVRYTFGADAPVPRLVTAGLTDATRAFFGELFKSAVTSGIAPVAWDKVADRLGVPSSAEESSGEGGSDEDSAALNARTRREIAMLADRARAIRLEL